MTYGNAFKFWFLDAMVSDLNPHDMCEDDTNERLSVGQFTVPRGPTKRTLTAANGAFLGAKLACFWPSGLPKWHKIGLACMISVRLTPLGCLVVF